MTTNDQSWSKREPIFGTEVVLLAGNARNAHKNREGRGKTDYPKLEKHLFFFFVMLQLAK